MKRKPRHQRYLVICKTSLDVSVDTFKTRKEAEEWAKIIESVSEEAIIKSKYDELQQWKAPI